jgi:hypothetical protein
LGNRFFGFVGKGGDPVYLCLYFIQEFLQIPVVHYLYGHRRKRFSGYHFFFNSPDDGLLHLCRRGTRVFHGDGNHVQRRFRKYLKLGSQPCYRTGQQEKKHQQIGGNVILGKPSNGALHSQSSVE